MDSIKKSPRCWGKHRGSTDNKLGGGLITKYNFKFWCKNNKLQILNANSFVIIDIIFFSFD